MVDFFVGLGEAAKTVDHPRGQWQLDRAMQPPALWGELARIGHDRGQVDVRQSVVVLAGHQAQHTARGCDAVTNAAHPVDFFVGGQCWIAARDVGARQLRALAIVRDRCARAIGAVGPVVNIALRLGQLGCKRSQGGVKVPTGGDGGMA